MSNRLSRAERDRLRQELLKRRAAARRTIAVRAQLLEQAHPTRPLTPRERQIIAGNMQARDRQQAKARLFGKDAGERFGGNRAQRRRLLGVVMADNKKRVKRKVGQLRAQG